VVRSLDISPEIFYSRGLRSSGSNVRALPVKVTVQLRDLTWSVGGGAVFGYARGNAGLVVRVIDGRNSEETAPSFTARYRIGTFLSQPGRRSY
jgi:hypothetical protein